MRENKVQRLTERLRRNREYRERLNRMGAEQRERLAIIQSAPTRQKMGFWCERCRKDVDSIGHLKDNIHVFDIDKGHSVMSFRKCPIGWYEARCPKGHVLYRNLTDKLKDRYFVLSDILKRDRARYQRDLLQPSDPRFKQVYPEQWRKIEEQRKLNEEILKDI